MSKSAGIEHSAFDLMDEAIFLVRHCGVGTLATYFTGCVPFMVGFLYFWSDMSQSAFAWRYAASAALILTLLFAWMKVMQSVFCRRLWNRRMSLPDKPVSLPRLWRLMVTQMTIQPWGLIALPVSLVLMFPFGWVHAYFQNVTVIGADEPGTDGIGISQNAVSAAKSSAMQNHILIWILSPWLFAATMVICFGLAALVLAMFYDTGGFWMGMGDIPWFVIGSLLLFAFVWPLSPLAIVIAANVALVLVLVPQLLNSLLGIETLFVTAGIYSYANSTLLLCIYCATYLVLDPLVKAVYTLRCVYSDSIRTGADILADLQAVPEGTNSKRTNSTTESRIVGARRHGVVAAILAISIIAAGQSVVVPTVVAAEEAAIERSGRLDDAIQNVLEEREFSWRIPRESAPTDEFSSSWLDQILKSLVLTIDDFTEWLGHQFERFFDWLDSFFQSRETQDPKSRSIDWAGITKITGIIMSVAAGTLIMILLVRMWKQRRAGVTDAVTVQDSPATPVDLASDNTTADQLPEDEWFALALEMLERGETRLALRAYFLGSLAYLGRMNLLKIKPFKSNLDYRNELLRHAHAWPRLDTIFASNVAAFERSWYGDHEVSNEIIEKFRENIKSIEATTNERA